MSKEEINGALESPQGEMPVRVVRAAPHTLYVSFPNGEPPRDTTEFASSDLIGYMLNQRTGCMGPSGEDAEQEAEDFAALLIYRLGRLPSDRSSIVQVRLGGVAGITAPHAA